MKKILTMTLNPCIDRTVYFETFQAGATNIVKKVIEEAAGKGINVAVGLQHLQVPVKALGFAYKEDCTKLYGKLETEQIPYSFVEVDGRLRVNQKLFDESRAEMTECNEKGCIVIKEAVDKLLELLRLELKDASILVLSGSVPPGVADDIYMVMTSMAKQAGVKVILDANGELLRKGVEAGPYLIKPNRDEFVKTFLNDEIENKQLDINVNFEERLHFAAQKLMSSGLAHICLSMGEDGAMMISMPKDGTAEDLIDNKCHSLMVEKRPAIPVQVRSLQGAGDAMVAGLCKAIYEEREDKMLDYALAMAASTIALEGTQMGSM